MKRFFGRKFNGKIILEGAELLHLKKVLRITEGEEVIACIDDEYDYLCVVEKINKNDCLLSIKEKNICPALPQREITLFQMLPKKEYFDNIIAKSVELGVNKIIPFTSKYTMIKEIKEERVATQIITACKQCERSKLVDFSSPIKIEQIPSLLKEYDLVLFAYENEEQPFSPSILSNKQKIAVIVGNEGGFSEEEATLLKKYSTCISLGKRILRCDTAVVATLSLVSILTNN